jgi:hypothetical protein
VKFDTGAARGGLDLSHSHDDYQALPNRLHTVLY